MKKWPAGCWTDCSGSSCSHKPGRIGVQCVVVCKTIENWLKSIQNLYVLLLRNNKYVRKKL